MVKLVDWIDLPDDNYIAVLGYETPHTIALNALVKEYSQIRKDQIDTLSYRIQKLDQIVEFVLDWIQNKLSPIDKKKHLTWIAEIADKKRNYLSCLLDIYVNKRHEAESQHFYHQDISSQKDRSYQAVILNNFRYFSLKLREYWGDFWFESLDPCHRRLTPFLDQWREFKAVDNEIPHFFLWLETQHIPHYVPRVKYLKDDELEKTRVVIKDGLFWEKTDSEWSLANFNAPAHRYLFAINLQGEIFVADAETGVSHSSFTCGGPVLGAGLLQVTVGQLTTLVLESGHYLPSIEIGHQILRLFEQKGARLPHNLEMVFFYDRNKYRIELAASPLPNFEQFKQALELAYTHKMRDCHESKTV